jgi:hypothetical protein
LGGVHIILGDWPILRLACTFVPHILLSFVLAMLIVNDTNQARRSFQVKGRLALEERFFHYGKSFRAPLRFTQNCSLT